LKQHGLDGNKYPFKELQEKDVALILRDILDIRNHPVLIHCNKGEFFIYIYKYIYIYIWLGICRINLYVTKMYYKNRYEYEHMWDKNYIMIVTNKIDVLMTYKWIT
jgi:hypothetical protein